MADEQVVQTTEPASPVVPVSTTEPSAPETPSPEEVLNQKISEAVSKALAVETEKSRREIQSAKDKAMAEVAAIQRRARMAEDTTGAIRARIQSLDPETAKELELTELRERERQRVSMEQEGQAAQYQAQVVQRFHDNMTQFVTGLGVNPTDQRIDWANDAPDLLTAQQRILDSVAKIQKEKEKASIDEIDKKIKEAEKRIKKDLGVGEDVNSVSTQMSGGISGSGIPTDKTRFGTWVNSLSIDEYAKLKPKIDEMLAKEQIK